MTHIDDRVIELARTALSFEFGGEHFYREAARATENPSGKAMFKRLAAEEKSHMEDMHALFGALIGEDMWQQLVAEEQAHPHRSKVVEEMEQAFQERGHAEVADDTQALRLAMELERKAIRFFEELASHTKDSDLVKLIRKMADEERFHYDMLQAQLDSLLNVGIWLDDAEFRVDGRF